MEDHRFLNNMIKRMRKQLKMSFNQTNISHINTRKLSYDSFSESIYDKFSGIFTPDIIKKQIRTYYNHISLLKFEYQKITINFNYITKNNNNDFLDLLIMIVKANAFINSCKNSSFISINVYYMPTPYKKNIGNEDYLGPKHVNSGYTLHDNYIVIYRKEESHKVLIHELVHYLKLDFSTAPCLPDICNNITDNFDVVTNREFVNIFEAYTDFIAIIYNSIFNSIIFDISFYSIISIEQYYQKCITNKILHKFNMNHICPSYNKSGNKLIQYSNVLSYYFLKKPLIDNYLYIIQKYRLGTKWDINKILEFYNYILLELRNTEFTPKNFINNSLRMSYLF